MDKLIIDGHAHCCGEYLTVNSIKNKLNNAKTNMVVLTPGQYGSKTTYSMKNLTLKDPYADVVTKNNHTNRILMSIVRTIKTVPKGNEYVFKLKCEIPDKIKQCYWVTKDNWHNVDSDYTKMHFDMLKFHQCWEKFDIQDDNFVKTVKWSEQYKIPVFIHVYNKEQIAKLISFIKNNSDAIIIVGHLYQVEMFIKEDLKYFKNTYFDLSNMHFVSKERTMLAYNHFGAGKLMLGSDTPYGKQSLEKTIAQINSLDISQDDKNKILGGNMAQLLNI